MTQLYAQQSDCVASSPRFASRLATTNDLTSRFVAAANAPDLINLAGGLPAAEADGGMFVWATARHASIDTDRLVPVAMNTGVMVGPSSVFDPWGQNRHALRLNFTLNAPERLVDGVRRLAQAVRILQRQR
ncbi:hypothetical protein G3O06_17690 [Burkholderia sp. Ac-20345]|uniref:hypothetical protein n=1 Tax=Burkholderia sp. Ac-20345 TaxID=2703891 RepID=UPI00197C7B39|nr:hypothetical protein [Burkholderia sp. Ac-20345]MBN3779370.1 hypothetical protein [Burkholderia sp. Ac-20345]